MKTIRKPRKLLRFSLGIKLVLIVTLILLGSIWTVTFLMGLMVSSEFVQNTENVNFIINDRAAAGIEERLNSIRSEALLLLDMSSTVGDNVSLNWQLKNIFFERNPAIAAIIIPGKKELINQQFFNTNEISNEKLTAWLAEKTIPIERAKKNDPVIMNASPVFRINLLALFYPWQGTGFEDAVVVFFSPQNLLEITATGTSSTLVVNGDGDLLVSQDFSQLLTGENISNSAITRALEKDPGETVRISYSEAGNRFLAAGRRISSADAMVFSVLDYSLITRQITAVSRRNILLSVTVMFLAVLITWFFSKSITNPLKKLIAAAGRIELGEFDIVLEPKSHDELGLLTERFNNMGKGLSKWEEKKELAGRQNNQMITRKFMLKDENFKGENLQAVVLFVDLVSFMDIAGKNNAKEALFLLNSHISQMTECVEKQGGVVDKIMGSSLFALWGIPVSKGDFTEEVMNSIHAALMMRNVISKRNSRKSQDSPMFRMACGIHTGIVLAGSMGVTNYSSYTVTGETVNNAAKCGEISAQTGTDIVISKEIRDLTGNRILAEELTLPRQYAEGFSVFGLSDLAPAEGRERQTVPDTFMDAPRISEIKDIMENKDKKETKETKKGRKRKNQKNKK